MIGYIPTQRADGDWLITYLGRVPTLDPPHPTFADADSARVYIDLLEAEHGLQG